jgi:teichuronic acid biosynthesis glycosyltransferase TuaG
MPGISVQPLVSVVIPAYKCEKYIAEALESAINQTYKSIEIIIVNDCSPDNCESVILEYMEKDKRIRYLKNNENLGVASSRNKGVKASEGEYVAFLDSDDVWSLDKIEKQIKHLQENNGYFCYTSYRLVDESGGDLNKVYIVPESVEYKKLLYHNVINSSTAVIKRDILIQHPMKHDEIHEDYLEWLTLLKFHGKALGLTECLALYRQVKQSRSNNKFKSFLMTNEVYKLEGIHFFLRLYYLWHYSINGIKKYWIG